MLYVALYVFVLSLYCFVSRYGFIFVCVVVIPFVRSDAVLSQCFVPCYVMLFCVVFVFFNAIRGTRKCVFTTYTNDTNDTIAFPELPRNQKLCLCE